LTFGLTGRYGAISFKSVEEIVTANLPPRVIDSVEREILPDSL
jgi:hypothetical protein